MPVPTRAAIYARISSDPEGTRAGVDRQLADCHGLAASLGWHVAEEYVDNDVSAYRGKPRPDYDRMLADVADGGIDGVLVYNIDRLTRRPAELEQFAEAMLAAKITDVRFVTGDTDITTTEGMLMARVLGAFAAQESAKISSRVSRKMEQVAAEGRPHGGAFRPFGYADDKITVRPDEARIFQTIVARFLAGESTRSLATWLNKEAVPTVSGRPWVTPTLKGMLTNPRYAGLRTHRGAVVGHAVWDAIITEEDHRRVLGKYAEKKISGRRTPQRYLLSGLLRCGKCETRLYSSARANSRRYVCLSGPDHRGCGRLTVVADPLERLVADAVLYRLDTPELAGTLAGRSSTDERVAELSTALDDVQERLDELPAAFAAGEITRRDWSLARKPLEDQFEQIQRQLSRLTRTSALTGLVGNGEELRRTWGSLNLDRQHAIVGAVVDHVVIGPGTPGAQTVAPSRVGIVWRH